ncbi:MAG: TatD family hydrolase [Coriobacteriales bacterium]
MPSDAHIHLGALSSGPQVAQLAQRSGARLLAVTCTPAEFASVRQRFEGAPNVLVGLGLHPWELEQAGEEEAEQLLAALESAAGGQRWLGEVGLDLSGRFAASAALQLRVFGGVCRTAATEERVVSLHTRGAELEALQLLEEAGALKRCTCIFHGFAGGGPALARILEAGCMVSMGPRQLASRRGREYARQLPAQRLLLETDADASTPQRDPSPQEWASQMRVLLQQLEQLRSCSMEAQLEENWHRVFGEL